MNKIFKIKKGFTLIEMVLVVFILIVLASVLFVAAGQYINQAKTVKVIVSSKNSSFASQNSSINDEFIDLGY